MPSSPYQLLSPLSLPLIIHSLDSLWNQKTYPHPNIVIRISGLMHVAHKQVSQLFGLGQTVLKGMFCLNHSTEQTTLVSASNLQCSILIVPSQMILSRYTFPFFWWVSNHFLHVRTCLHNVCLNLKNIWISFCMGLSIFSVTSNRLEILSPSTFLTAPLQLLGTLLLTLLFLNRSYNAIKLSI